MNHNKKWVSQACFALITLFAFVLASPVFASSVTGGVMTLNINSTDLAAAFAHDNDPLRPSIYLEEYFDSAQAASRTPSELLTDHIVPGAGQISTIDRQLTVNGSSTNGLNIANNFSFLANDLTGTAAGAIGLGGAMRYRLDVPFTINPVTGDEEGNRTMTGYFSLEYDASRVDSIAGHSGWAIFNHHTFRADIFDLDNVVTNLTGNSLTLSGDLALATGFDHLGGQHGTIVGDFNFQTTVVPVPAAVWLFVSAFAGVFVTRSVANRNNT
jgi:hypothetical protein